MEVMVEFVMDLLCDGGELLSGLFSLLLLDELSLLTSISSAGIYSQNLSRDSVDPRCCICATFTSVIHQVSICRLFGQ